MTASRPLPNIGAPATRALAEVGVRDMDAVKRIGLDRLATLHGVGPKSLRVLKASLEEWLTAGTDDTIDSRSWPVLLRR